MRKCTNIFTIYEEVVLHPIPLNFLIYEENFLFFFIGVPGGHSGTKTKSASETMAATRAR